MKNVIVCVFALLSLQLFAGVQDGIERIKKLNIDQIDITDVKVIEKGSEFKRHRRPMKAVTDIVLVRAQAKAPSKVKIAVALPLEENWNGIFMGRGNGGIASALNVNEAVYAANEGYAGAHCNLGTADWLHSKDLSVVVKDFGNEAVYKMTVAGKKIAEAFYQKAPKLSYYVGGSTGGQEGLYMAERHPQEYDAIAVMFPVSNRTRLHIRFAFEKLLLSPENYFSQGEISKITEAITEQNRNNAGEYSAAEKPYLKYPERAKVDYSKLDFLSKKQIEILKKVHSDFKDPVTGEFVTYSLPPTCEIADGGKSLKKGFDCWMLNWFFMSPKVDISKVDLHSYVPEFEKKFAAEVNALPNLKEFKKRGGKLLIIQGKLDTVVPAEYIKHYYAELCKNIGSVEKTREFARLFLVAGGWHGNIVVDNLALVRKWVEEKTAPENFNVKVNFAGKSFTEAAEPFLPEN